MGNTIDSIDERTNLTCTNHLEVLLFKLGTTKSMGKKLGAAAHIAKFQPHKLAAQLHEFSDKHQHQ